MATNEIVKFLRQKDLVLRKELGGGACGKTVLLHDPDIDELFVCKKFAPQFEPEDLDLFSGFLNEIKLLVLSNHPNVVRVFNHYVYRQQRAAFILMEYVNGSEIDEFLDSHPERASEVFEQTIDGFAYLEKLGVLHRDIRPGNILVTNDGLCKIIDFGFGKRINSTGDFDKSISLNWWCEPPNEFEHNQYDFTTEVYFVGKLFEKCILELNINEFGYKNLLA
ncbi:MAG: protein kinase family protein, partial [Phycisphaerales bacterium]|nr:protein kinase family protein [Phycisphaerales bacterium]